MSDNIKITDTPDGGCIVEMDGEVTYHTKEEIDEMERDYKNAIRRLLEKEVRWNGSTQTALSFAEDDSAVYGVTDALGRKQQKKFINESGEGKEV